MIPVQDEMGRKLIALHNSHASKLYPRWKRGAVKLRMNP